MFKNDPSGWYQASCFVGSLVADELKLKNSRNFRLIKFQFREN